MLSATLITLLATSSVAFGQNSKVLALIPRPQSIQYLNGPDFVFNAKTGVAVKSNVNLRAVLYLREVLNPATGFEVPLVPKPGLNTVYFRQVDSKPEGYTLNIASNRIDIAYHDEAGALHAVQTLRQLLPREVETKSRQKIRVSVPCIRIEDAPKFGWRGMHLDVSRHFFNVAYIKRQLDLMSLHKFNVFHWHLIDDGGWRLKVDKYPLLTSFGGWRAGRPGEWKYDGIRIVGQSAKEPYYGGFYTKAEIREVVEYATSKGITVVPEIEMPGHTTPSIATYPWLGCAPGSNVYCAGKEETFTFLQDVLNETMLLFPSLYIHIGGDEVDKGWWKKCKDCQARMKTEGLKNEDELQSYFIRRIGNYIASKGRRMIGWDEILEGGLAQGATVMSWRGFEGGVEAVRLGRDAIMSPTSHCYFDYSYESISTEKAFAFNPIPEGVTDSAKILGGQANVWTEWISSEAKCDRMIWPRLLGMSEALWGTNTDYRAFSARLSNYLPRLEQLGVRYFIEEPVVETQLNLGGLQETSVPLRAGYEVVFSENAVDWKRAKRKDASRATVPLRGLTYVAYRTPGGRLGDSVRILSKSIEPLPLTEDRPLEAEFAKGEFQSVDAFSSKPFNSLGSRAIGLAEFEGQENYGLRFKGIFNARMAGMYQFELTSDDGAVLYLAGEKALNLDGPRGATTVRQGVYLRKGGYPIELRYFQLSGASKLQLRVFDPTGAEVGLK